LIFLISLVLVIGLAGSASAATKYFEDGDANNHLWSNRWNWADGNVPVAADNARFQINGSRCIIDANNTTAVCVYTRFPSSQTTDYIYLDIEGGTLTTTSHVTVGYSNDAWDITKDVYMTVKSGTVNCGGDLIVSYWGEGSLIVEGGTINVTGVVEVAKGTNADKGFTVHIQLDGGQINCTDFTHVRTYVPVSMDIGAGKMTITGDKVAKIQGYVGAGWMTAYHGRGSVDVSLVTGNTEVTGVPNLGVAWGPNPASAATGVYPGITQLTWGPGDWANKHTVYYGTSLDDVNALGTPVSVEQEANSYAVALVYGDTYYWRVDEVNDVTDANWPGTPWNFSTANYAVVDEIEYDDTNDLLLTWSGSGGATISLDAIVDEDSVSTASMKFGYVGNSVAERTFDPVMDMKTYAIEGLDIAFAGTLGNAVERMYVGLEDEDTNYAEVAFEDGGALAETAWTQWTVALANFEFDGVDLTKIKKLYIGFGPGASGSGTVYFDDIRAYPCRGGGGADINDDCVVNFGDFAELADQWLARQMF